MAETWNKKEREKKKRQIRKEKAEKRSQRVGNNASGNNLESMYAYLDEDGNLTSTPPGTRKKIINTEGPANLHLS